MPIALTSREAKEFLVSQVVAEAEREDVPLSDIERKMLYSSETAWSLPDIYEVNEAFEQAYDSDEYETKIANLIKNLVPYLRTRDSQALKRWQQAIKVLRQEDHYILVLISISERQVATVGPSSLANWKAMIRLLLIVVSGAVILLAGIVIYGKLNGQM